MRTFIKGKTMKKIRIITATLIFLTSSTVLAQAQGAGTEWFTLNVEVKAFYFQGNYARAVVVAKQALEVAQTNVGPDHPDVASSLNNLALIYHTQGGYAKAEPLYKRSLAIREKALGPDHPDVANSLNNLAKLYRDTGRMNDAEKLEARAKKIRAIKR